MYPVCFSTTFGRHSFFFFLVLFPLLCPAAEPVGPGEPVAVFTPHEKYAYRIPALLTSSKGVLLAFAERRIGLNDHAENDIVLRRSLDGGRTWLDEQMLADNGGDSLNDPCAVLDRRNGRIFLLYMRYPKGFHAAVMAHTKEAERGYGGPRNTQTLLISSDDEGATWSAPRAITRVARRSDAISTGSPGVGIQLARGPHKGRLLFPLYETLGGSKWRNAALYSDDGGETWHLSERVPVLENETEDDNEAQLIELMDGTVVLNARNETGPQVRRVTHSRDGGRTWEIMRDEPGLPAPPCMGALLSLPQPESANAQCILCSLPCPEGRKKGTIYLSSDEGKTWAAKRILYPGGFAYSSLALLPDGRIGCLFEPENYHNISFLAFDAAWVTHPSP